MTDIKALIEELEVQYEAWGKQYTFEMILRDIEKFAAGGDADAEREEG